jgi:hypothetical protein
MSLNNYNKYWRDKHSSDIIDKYKKQAQVIDNCMAGNGEFYNKNINNDLLTTFLNNVANETFNDVTYLIKKKDEKGNEETVQIEEIQKLNTTSKMELQKTTFKDLFKKSFLYEVVGVSATLKNGVYSLDFLKPYQYHNFGDTVEIIVGFDKNGVAMVERRATSHGLSFVDGKQTDGLYFFEIFFESRFYNKLEMILDYQMINSNLSKEVELNKSKLIVDKKIYPGNTINTEEIMMIDVPNNIANNNEEKVNSYMSIKQSKNGLTEITTTLESKAKDLVMGFGLSKKTLGLGESADFASSLPYENELTAKTINSYRDYFEVQITKILQEILQRQDFMVDFGKYSLTSEEAVLDKNIKATQSQSKSISQKVADLLDEGIESEEVLKETIKIKIENNITLTLAEEIKAGELGLLPDLAPLG